MLQFDFPVEPPAAQQRVGKVVHIVYGSDDEDLLVLYFIDTSLYRRVFAVVPIRLRVPVHIIQQQHGRLVFCRRIKGGFQKLHEVILRLVSAHQVAGQAAFGHQCRRHQRFAQARSAVEQQPLGHPRAQRQVRRRTVDHIADLPQLRFDALISDDIVKCTHIAPPYINSKGMWFRLAKRWA